MARSLVVIPTYNESENIPTMIPRVLAQHDSLDILIVDDNSPDGTARIVKDMQQSPQHGKRVHLIERASKLGLGTAYVAGFTFALEHGYDFVFEMDADFSHDPEELPRLLAKAQEFDLVIGSRYISGVNVVNWPMRRLILSYMANLYTRVITGLPVRDTTSGFVCIRRSVLEQIDLASIRSNGYAFQIEIKFLAWKKGFRLLELPIIFVDRRVGISKMSKGIMTEAALMVWKLKLRSLF
ncbi:MAG TPA: polyprenol monophosphomannose synthase [Bacteroidota bacterium]